MMKPPLLIPNANSTLRDRDRINRRYGYFMIAIYVAEMLCLVADGFLYVHGATNLWNIWSSVGVLVFLTGVLYFTLRSHGLGMRDWWSPWFAYTMVPDWERFPFAIKDVAAEEVAEWCRHSLHGRWCMTDTKVFRINRKKDAALFRLFWG